MSPRIRQSAIRNPVLYNININHPCITFSRNCYQLSIHPSTIIPHPSLSSPLSYIGRLTTYSMGREDCPDLFDVLWLKGAESRRKTDSLNLAFLGLQYLKPPLASLTCGEVTYPFACDYIYSAILPHISSATLHSFRTLSLYAYGHHHLSHSLHSHYTFNLLLIFLKSSVAHIVLLHSRSLSSKSICRLYGIWLSESFPIFLAMANGQRLISPV
ncbi:hypothetical protein EDD18DRAFT_8080 [Armillaria luteobubalina]|uniref:Uncharacterized protein n=1 Tax=Armillaria luteobubalina TaxID=153913 RepID=A0AA39QQ14_9AGAR|nr:hypothetical protein EDD18DRAFT_8080 [Armillaria luteobubalina]